MIDDLDLLARGEAHASGPRALVVASPQQCVPRRPDPSGPDVDVRTGAEPVALDRRLRAARQAKRSGRWCGPVEHFDVGPRHGHQPGEDDPRPDRAAVSGRPTGRPNPNVTAMSRTKTTVATPTTTGAAAKCHGFRTAHVATARAITLEAPVATSHARRRDHRRFVVSVVVAVMGSPAGRSGRSRPGRPARRSRRTRRGRRSRAACRVA